MGVWLGPDVGLDHLIVVIEVLVNALTCSITTFARFIVSPLCLYTSDCQNYKLYFSKSPRISDK